MTEEHRRHIRFAVGSRTGPRSTIWKCWIQRNEVYITSRMFGHESKVSLHSTGECQWSNTGDWVLRQTIPRNADRHIFRWKLNYPTSNDALLAFRVAIPESELRILEPPTDKKKVFWIGNVVPGATVQFLFFITAPCEANPPTEHTHYKHLASMQLSNKRWVVIFIELVSLSTSDIHFARDVAIQQVREAGIVVLPKHRIALFVNGGECGSHGLLEVCPTSP